MSPMFWQYRLLTNWEDEKGFHNEPLCIGERVKKGTFRPCLTKAIPFSSVVGALHTALGIPWEHELIAAGYLDGSEELDYTVIAPNDVALGVAKPPAPITAQFLWGAEGRVFVDAGNEVVRQALEQAGQRFEITIGAMKSTGFGRCLLKRVSTEVPLDIIEGRLRSRIPEKLKDRFGIANVIKPVYGYLFERTDDTTGVYVRSLYEGSVVEGYSFLVDGGDGA